MDVIHTPDGRRVESVGGAALYTSLAAECAGADVTMLAVKPQPMLPALSPIDKAIEWVGPAIPSDHVPHLEIAHYGGGKAKLLDASWGDEPLLTPESLPRDLSDFALVHIAALSSAKRQYEFLQACRVRGAKRISVGVYARVVYGEPDVVRQMMHDADIFFMNENEANGMFGSVDAAQTTQGKLLFVTMAERGALVFDGETSALISTEFANEIDPTGAGDTFCGTTLAAMLNGISASEAAARGNAMARKQVQSLGAEMLMRCV